MSSSVLLLVGAALGLTIFPLSGLAAGQEQATFCRAASTAAVEAGRLRDAGAIASAAAEMLQTKFSAEETQAGVNTAFAYKQLKEFALFDLATTYCTKMLSANGKPSDFEKLWVRTHYERASECSMQGQFEREPYLKCWDAQATRDERGVDKVVVAVMNLEAILAEIKACEARFPQYITQNRRAFSESALSRISSEAIIDTYAGIGAKQALLKGLESQRASSPYLTMEAGELEKRCSSFPQAEVLRSAK